MLISIVQDQRLQYPDASEHFSPSTRYPEYPFRHVAQQPNAVYDAVRTTLLQAGLDRSNAGTARWNPLGAYITPGARVFVLCNFVYHRKPLETTDEFLSKCTHGSVVRAIIDYVHIAAGASGIISYGNAPLQGCEWHKVLAETGADNVARFYDSQGLTVTPRDLRLFVTQVDDLGRVVNTVHRDESDGVTVKLGARSLLNALYRDHASDGLRLDGSEIDFRVSEYSPDRTAAFHGVDRHDYVINSEILASDVVVSVPKLKTHEKVGITVGLKGMVGCVGHKDCLAHHRFGPPRLRGDEYPEGSAVRVLLSRFHDFVYRRRYPGFMRGGLEVLDKNARRVVRKVFRRIQSGAWFGNDTAWRMTLDLAHIMHFADRSGRMTDREQRRHLVLVDGVVGGEGNGPLSSRAAPSKSLVFSDRLLGGDIAAVRLMGYRVAQVPLVSHAQSDAALGGGEQQDATVIHNDRHVRIEDVTPSLGRAFVPPIGWKDHLG